MKLYAKTATGCSEFSLAATIPPDELLEARELREHFHRMIFLQLSKEKGDVMWLRFYEGLSWEEIKILRGGVGSGRELVSKSLNAIRVRPRIREPLLRAIGWYQ